MANWAQQDAKKALNLNKGKIKYLTLVAKQDREINEMRMLLRKLVGSTYLKTELGSLKEKDREEHANSKLLKTEQYNVTIRLLLCGCY